MTVFGIFNLLRGLMDLKNDSLNNISKFLIKFPRLNNLQSFSNCQRMFTLILVIISNIKMVNKCLTI